MFKVRADVAALSGVDTPEGYQFVGVYDRDNMEYLLTSEFKDLKWKPCSAFAFFIGEGVAQGLFVIEHHPNPHSEAGYFYLYSSRSVAELCEAFEDSIYTVAI